MSEAIEMTKQDEIDLLETVNKKLKEQIAELQKYKTYFEMAQRLNNAEFRTGPVEF